MTSPLWTLVALILLLAWMQTWGGDDNGTD